MTDRHEKAANDGGSIKVGDHARIWRRGDTWWINIQVHRRQVRRSLETTNKAEATKRALKIERGMVEGNLDLDRDKITLDEAIDAYDAFLVSEGRAKRTLTQYRHTFKLMRQIAAELGRPLLIQVDLTFTDRFRTLRVDQGKAPKTIHTETTILRQVVNHSRRRNLLSRDPLAGLRLVKPKPRPQPGWTQEEVQRILAASSTPHRDALELLAETGMRVGELKHLTWADVAMDGPHPVLHIRPKDGWKPKTGDIRAIPLSPRAVELLRSLPRHSRWVIAAPPRGTDPQGLRQFSERRLLLHLKRLLARIGLPGHLHTFRHAFISHAASEGVPEAVIRSWVGHVDAQILRLYMHIADRTSQGWMQRLHGQADGSATPKPPAKPGGSAKKTGRPADKREDKRGG